ncbi:MAG: hypothetical protein ACJ8H8_25185, partial [Geminicoccaceae bacterium]
GNDDVFQNSVYDDIVRGGAGNDDFTAVYNNSYSGGVDAMYGGAGNDTFRFDTGDISWTAVGGGDTIFDFQGAGKYGGGTADNDFIQFYGYDKATAYLTYVSNSAPQPNLQYYKVGDASGWSWLSIKIAVGESATPHLGSMDYHFY